MIDYIVSALRQNPELAIFLTLALGFLHRPDPDRNVQAGQRRRHAAGRRADRPGRHVDVPATVKVVFFDLFLFATGYKVGPQFFRGLKKNALPQLALTVVLCVTSLLMTVAAAKIFGYDSGTAAGLMAGAFTESTVIGTAGDTIARLDVPDAEKKRMLDNIPVAYAVSYLVGTGFVVWFLSSLAPRLLRVDLKAEGRKLAAQMSSAPASEAGSQSAYREWDVRAMRLPDGPMAGRSVAELEKAFAPDRVFVQRIRRGGEMVDADPDSLLQAGDVVAVAARRQVFLRRTTVAQEVEDRELLDFPVAALDVVVTNRELADRPLQTLAEEHRAGRRPAEARPRR